MDTIIVSNIYHYSYHSKSSNSKTPFLMSSYLSRSEHHQEKNVFKTTTNKPLRFAVLGSHKSSKSAFVSIISNNISLENYYPTIQNSPILLQFQPKRVTSRAILDINVTLKNLKGLKILKRNENSTTLINLSKPLLNKINQRSINSLKKIHQSSDYNVRLQIESSETILNETNGYYDLDYSNPNLFNNENFSPINSFHSPIASFSRGQSFGHNFNNSIGRKFPTIGSFASSNTDDFDNNNNNDDDDDDNYDEDDNNSNNNKNKYKAPVTTPILVELIDTPGVQKEDLIPFLEKSLDNRLSKDVLSNLANDYNTNYRSRVKPLITGSGISDLNAAVNGYILFYSCVPEFEKTDSMPPPPMYNESNEEIGKINDDGIKTLRQEYLDETKRETFDGMESLEILKSLYASIVEAWKEYQMYYHSWETGKEYDDLSITSSFKQLWKNKDKNTKDFKDFKELKDPSQRKKLQAYIEQNLGSDNRPPIIIVCSHIDSPYAAPLLIEKGRQLADNWGCSFVEMSCAYDSDKWVNVEETLAIAIRESVERKRNK